MAKVKILLRKPSTSTSAKAIVKSVASGWLPEVCKDLKFTAKALAPKKGEAARTFFLSVSGTKGTVTCKGPKVRYEAFDSTYMVPAGGYKYGDMNPKTGKPFPGGISKYGTYIILDDKPREEGEAAPIRSRVYTKKAGQTISHVGFFDEAVRRIIGSGTSLSGTGRKHIESLATTVAVEYVRAVANKLRIAGNAEGITITADRPTIR